MSTTPDEINRYADEFRRHYIVAMLWANVHDEEGSGTAGDDLSVDDLTVNATLEVNRDVSAFLASPVLTAKPGAMSVYETLVEHGIGPEQAGHDFALTRNHHGAGFWDRGYGEVGDLLTTASHLFGESSWWVNGGLADVE